MNRFDYEPQSLLASEMRSCVFWGEDNLFPDHAREQTNNPYCASLLKTKADFTVGKGYYLYRRVFDQKSKRKINIPLRNNEISDFLDRNEADDILRKAALDLETFGNSFIELVPSPGKNKIESFFWRSPTECRIGKMYSSDPLTYKLADWSSQPCRRDAIELPCLDPRHLRLGKSMIHQTKAYFPGAVFYGSPGWIGASEWIQLMNKIAVFYGVILDNQAVPRWHMEIPDSYFEGLSGEKKAELKAELTKKLKDGLFGAENAGKIFLSEYTTHPTGMKTNQIIIKQLDSELSDKHYIRWVKVAARYIAIAVGVSTTIARIIEDYNEPSGSQVFWSVLFQEKVKSQPGRMLLVEVFEQIKKINNWPKDVYVGIYCTLLFF